MSNLPLLVVALVLCATPGAQDAADPRLVARRRHVAADEIHRRVDQDVKQPDRLDRASGLEKND